MRRSEANYGGNAWSLDVSGFGSKTHEESGLRLQRSDLGAGERVTPRARPPGTVMPLLTTLTMTPS
jgi:hypothetical protein